MTKPTLSPLTIQDLKNNAPSIFTTEPSYKVSQKYSFIPTTRIVEDLNKLGWEPYEASQRKSRNSKFNCRLVEG